MKKRIVLSLAVILLAFSLCSCASVTVCYQLTNDNTVSVDYKLSLPSGEDASTYIDAISSYWKQMGFTASSVDENGTYTLTGNKKLGSDSRSTAAAKLSSILTDDNSFFYDAEFKYTPSYFEDSYSFTAKMSLEDIIRKSEDRSIPAAEVQTLIASAKEGTYRLSITLPGEVTETNADEQDGQTCIWLIKYGETKEISIASKQVFKDNLSHYAALNETEKRDDMFFMICGIAAGLLVLIIVIAVLARRARRSKVGVERF
jgi:hypothetical protein